MTTTEEAGRKGGKTTAKRGKRYYREIQKKSVAARLANKGLSPTSAKSNSKRSQDGV